MDQANVVAEISRNAAISSITSRYKQPQLIVDGDVICRDCELPIPPKRLEKMPDAALCVGCQEAQELEDSRYVG